MNKKWLPHGITAGVLGVFIVLGLACASASEARREAMQWAYNKADIQFLAYQQEFDLVLDLLNTYSFTQEVLNSTVYNSEYGDYVNPGRFTALMSAARAGRLDVVQALVERGANVNLRVTADGEYKGKSASALAYDAGYIEIVNYLKAHGAIDFEPLQGQPSNASPASSAPSQSTYAVLVWYTASGNRLSTVYSVQAASKNEAEREAERQWKTQWGWNTAMQFQEAIAQ
jgi:ankyrin repeat protein